MTDIIMKPEKADIADRAYENLLKTVDKVSPELSDLLKEKYEADRKEFAAAAKDFSPSDEPAYWAKGSCRKCYGRGIIGQRYIFMPSKQAESVRGEDGVKKYINAVTQTPIQCLCPRKGYQKWLAEFRVFFNMLKAQTVAEAVETVEGESDEA